MMTPTRDIVFLEADSPPTRTASGLYMQEQWKTLPPFGTVLAIGPDVTKVKVGDRVVFERYSAVMLKGQERLCKESHILATLEGEESA